MKILNTANIGDVNKNLILKTIRTKGPISRADISRELSISKPAVSKNIKELLEADIVKEIGQGDNDIGRKSTLIAFNSEKSFVIGVDIGNFKIRVGLADLSGKIKKIIETETYADSGGEKIIQRVDEAIIRICSEQQIHKDKILAICIGIPGLIDEMSKKTYLTPFIKNLENVDIPAYFNERFNAHIIIKNNVNAGALGEYKNRYPEEIDCKNVVYINLGIGIGAGIILDGDLYTGKNNAAGEIGFCCFRSLHEPIPDKDAGSYEKSISVKYLIKKYNFLVDKEKQLGVEIEDVSELFDRYDKHETEASEIIVELIENILMLLISITAILNVDVIIFGGGLGGRMKKYFPCFKKKIVESVPFMPIIRDARLGTLSGVYGAIYSALSEVLVDYKNLQ